MSSSPVVLITGCSTGFGRAIAEAALKASYRVVATARKVESLDELKAQGAQTLPLDVTAPEDELRKFADKALAIYGQVDILINNAGYLLGGAIEENSHQATLAQFNTNFFGLINITNAFLPHFRERKTGTIVNISSQGAVLNFAGAGVYCASKAAVDSISESWASELAEFNIRCVSIQLGSFRTSVATSNNCKSSEKQIEGYNKAHQWLDGFQKAAGTESGDPQKAAKKLIEFVGKPGPLPARLPLGEDSVQFIVDVLKKQRKEWEEYKHVGLGTSFDA